ncbi:hypothetical protein [Parasphingorhabdus sp.]
MIDDIKRDRDAGGDDMPTNIMKVPVRVASTNLRRKSVDRVLAMEAALITAERLEKFVDLVDGSFGGGRVITFSDADIAECKEALAAYRAATGAA